MMRRSSLPIMTQWTIKTLCSQVALVIDTRNACARAGYIGANVLKA